MDALKDLIVSCFQKLGRWISTKADAEHTGLQKARLISTEADAGHSGLQKARLISTEADAEHSGLEKLAFGLNKRLANDACRTDDNLIFSPLSIYVALSLVAAGARERTLDELLGVLGASSPDDLAGYVRELAEQALADRSQTGGPHIKFAFGVWHDETRALRPAYRDAAVESYKTETCAVDFHGKPMEAENQINGWVAARTNNLISKIIERGSLSSLTDLVLANANAIYFKGKWVRPFNKEDTKEDKFHRLDGSTVDVPFMQTRTRQHIACHDGFKVLQLHYKRGNMPAAQPAAHHYSMCIFLPDERKGLWRLVDKIARTPDFLHRHLPTSDVLVGDVRLPRFKLAFSISMTDVLRELGLKEALEDEKADLSGMVVEDSFSRKLTLHLHEILHKAILEVNEEGTEAAAVTALHFAEIECSLRYKPPPPVDFVADHPFAFYVIEEVSGAILFAGHVLDPSRSE